MKTDRLKKLETAIKPADEIKVALFLDDTGEVEVNGVRMPISEYEKQRKPGKVIVIDNDTIARNS